MAIGIAMDFSFLLLLCIASVVPQAFANCGPCTSPPKSGPIITPKPPITIPPVIGKPPITIPPVIGKPPITIPPVIGKPPITIPPVIGKPPITIPPVIGKPPITIPPVIGKPPITIPPVIGKPPIALPPLPPLVKPLPPVTGTPAPPSTKPKPKPKPKPSCPPSPGKAPTCPIDTVKFGACLDVLGVVGGHVGDPAVKCCPLIKGLASAEAALCLCTTIKLKVLSVKLFLPIATQLFITCGKALPPGYTCA